MPGPEYPPFDPDATLEEFIGIGKNPRFDQKIDDDEDEEIQVLYKRGEIELPLAKPSRAVYFGDRVVYDQEAKLFDDAERVAILNSQEYQRNDKPSANSSVLVETESLSPSLARACL